MPGPVGSGVCSRRGHSGIKESTIRSRGLTLGVVFGPLNGPRIALVELPGWPGSRARSPDIRGRARALSPVAIHGLGWLYLYRSSGAINPQLTGSDRQPLPHFPAISAAQRQLSMRLVRIVPAHPLRST